MKVLFIANELSRQILLPIPPRHQIVLYDVILNLFSEQPELIRSHVHIQLSQKVVNFFIIL